MPISSDQFTVLLRILTEKFDSQDFDRFFKLSLARDLEDEVNVRQPFKDVVLDAIELAEKGGWLRKMIEKAIDFLYNEHKTEPLDLIRFLKEFNAVLPLSADFRREDFSLLISLCKPPDPPDQLKDALRRQREMILAKKRTIPLICIVHGDNDELLDKFRERLAFRELKAFLRNIYQSEFFDKGITKQIFVPWEKVDKLAQSFSKNVLEKFGCPYNSEDQNQNLRDALNLMADFPEPTFCYYHSYIKWDARQYLSKSHSVIKQFFWSINPFGQSPRKSLQNNITEFLKFWNKMAAAESYIGGEDLFALKTDILPYPLMVFIFYNYQHFGEPDKKYKWLNEQMFDYFTDLDFTDYPNLCGVVLPHLEPVEEPRVYNWLNGEFNGFCRRHPNEFCNSTSLKKDVEKFYVDNEDLLQGEGVSGSVRMRVLNEFLNEKLNQYSCRDRI